MPKNKEIVEYLPTTHIYLINGVIVPSVSALCSFATGYEYKNIPEKNLKKAQDYGTLVHEAIEQYEKSGDIKSEAEKELEKYKEIKKSWFLEVVKSEEQIHYKNLYAGRLDCIDQMGKIWDWKTNSKPNEEYWSWQTGYYYLGAKYCGLIKEIKSEAHIMWLPKRHLDKAKVITVTPKSEAELLENYKKWRESKNEVDSTKWYWKMLYVW